MNFIQKLFVSKKTVRQHFPAFMDFDPQTSEFKTQEDLLNISWIKSKSEIEGFYRFSIADSRTQQILMAEYDSGEIYYVVGYLSSSQGLTFPEWKTND